MSFQHRSVQGLGVEKRTHPLHLLGGILLALTLLVLGTQAAQAVSCDPVSRTCTCGIPGGYEYLTLNGSPWQTPSANLYDLRVIGGCRVLQSNVKNSRFFFKNVNILNGGILLFYENDYKDPNDPDRRRPGNNSTTDFWASSIIIENGGRLFAYGRDAADAITWQPFGVFEGVLTIHLYGKNDAVWDRNTQRFTQQNQGALCKTPLGTPTGAGKTPAPCGIPQDVWESNGASEKDLPALDAQENQILVRDYFYQYGPLHGDGRCSDTSTGAPGSMWSAASGCAKTNEQPGYFGNKVLAVSYGAVLALKGYKGATYSETDALASVNNWRRLADGRSLQPGETELVLESAPDWGAGDEIVVTTTDYLPGHSENCRLLLPTKAAPRSPLRLSTALPRRSSGYTMACAMAAPTTPTTRS
jgi:cell migration-inducing and hyaluronan-binding protein